ncbi:MAG: hypothetical protein V7646_1049 [Pseudonocardia sp.]
MVSPDQVSLDVLVGAVSRDVIDGAVAACGVDQLKTHLRGPGRVLRSRLPDLVHQEIWAWLIVHYAVAVLISRAAEAADPDPDRVSFTRALRIVRRTATGTAAFPPRRWTEVLPAVLAEIPARPTPCAVTAPAPEPSNTPATTATASRNPANPPAPATTGRPPSGSTSSTPAQHKQPKLRGIGTGARPGRELRSLWALGTHGHWRSAQEGRIHAQEGWMLLWM